MSFPTYVQRMGKYVLWSWGDYYYTIDSTEAKDVVIMANTDYHTALLTLRLYNATVM